MRRRKVIKEQEKGDGDKGEGREEGEEQAAEKVTEVGGE